MTRGAKARSFWITTILIVGLLVTGLSMRLRASMARKAAASQQVTSIRWPRVQVAPVEVRDITDQIVVSGITRPSRQPVLRAELQARVVAVYADVGEYVRAGTVLLEMDDERQAAAWMQAVAAITRDQAELDFARFDFEAKKKLWDDRHNRDLGVTESEYRRSEQSLRRAEAALALSDAALLSTVTELSKTVIVAPIDGVITRRTVDPGDLPSAGDELFTLADLRMVEVRLELAEPDVARLDRSRDVTGIRLESHRDSRTGAWLPITGSITAVSPVANPAGLFEVRITVANDQEWPVPDPTATQPEWTTIYLREVEPSRQQPPRTEPLPRPLPARPVDGWPAGMVFGGVSARVPVPLRTLRRVLVVPEAAVVRTDADETYVVVIERRSEDLDYFGEPERVYEERARHEFVNVIRYVDGYAVLALLAPPPDTIPGNPPVWKTIDDLEVPIKPGEFPVAVTRQSTLRDGEAVVVSAASSSRGDRDANGNDAAVSGSTDQ